MVGGPEDAAQLHGRALRHQQEPDGDPDRRIQPRLPAALRAEIGINYDERSQGTLQLFRKQKQLDGPADDIAVLKQYRRALRGARTATAASAPSPRSAASKDKFVGGLRLPRRTRPAIATCLRRRSPRSSAARRAVQIQYGIDRLVADGDKITGVATSARPVAGRCLCRGARQLVAAIAQADRHSRSGLSGEGLFDHGADHRSRRRAGIDRDGRELQGRDHAAGRPYPRRRHRGVSGLFTSSMRRGARRLTTLTDMFRAAATSARRAFWSGLRPMTPDGPPIIGATRYGNLHLNTGHGTLGWNGLRLGPGAGGSDVGTEADIDVSELTVSRYDHRFG